jgi:hypothetical protein
MTAIKTVAASVLAWGALGAIAEAAPMSSWFGGSSDLSVWYANQSFQSSGIDASVNSPAAASVVSTWSNDPAFLASLGVASDPAAAPTVAATPVIQAASSVPGPAGAQGASAFINFGNASYAEAGSLTTGTPQPWYTSPAVTQAFGSTPTAAQQASFTQSVLADIQHTFQISGMNITLTTDPTAPAAHMMSVVSGASYQGNPGAIGITTVGADGFGFIDKLAYANTPDQLAWAVAHNLSHELMHALGVATHPDQTGTFLDSTTASWAMLIDPNTKFSPQAVQMMLAASGSTGLSATVGAELLNLSHHPANCNCQFCQMLRKMGLNTSLVLQNLGARDAQLLETPVPEPSTVALWSAAGLGVVLIRRRTSRWAT